MNSLDTNVVLRFLLNDVQSQSPKAHQLFAYPPIYISDVVITEAIFVMEKGLGYPRKEIVSLVRVLMAVPGLVYRKKLLPDVVNMYERNRALSIVDCYAATEAKMLSGNLYTFDKKLLNQGGSHVLAP